MADNGLFLNSPPLTVPLNHDLYISVYPSSSKWRIQGPNVFSHVTLPQGHVPARHVTAHVLPYHAGRANEAARLL